MGTSKNNLRPHVNFKRCPLINDLYDCLMITFVCVSGAEIYHLKGFHAN